VSLPHVKREPVLPSILTPRRARFQPLAGIVVGVPMSIGLSTDAGRWGRPWGVLHQVLVTADVDMAIFRPGLNSERIEVIVDRGQIEALCLVECRAGVNGGRLGLQVVVVTGQVDEAGVVGNAAATFAGRGSASALRTGQKTFSSATCSV
jgi:hypothetical protein